MDFKSDRNTGQVPLSDDSTATLKSKFNKALQDSHDTGKFRIRAVTRLRNGGVLMELGSNEAVTWFAEAPVHERFLGNIHPAASIKPRLYHVVVQFVALTFRPDRDTDLREVKEANSIDMGDIVRARWIKPPAR